MEVLPLTPGGKWTSAPGWTTYPDGLDEAPECEILAGGVNTKMPGAAAIWRQGNLLHWGFEPAPDALDATGRDLLENAIRYVARFREDRPIVITPSVFVTKTGAPSRKKLIERWTKGGDDAAIDALVGAEARAAAAAAKTPEERRAVLAAAAGRLAPNAEKKLAADPDLVALGIARNDAVLVLERAAAALAEPANAAAARRVLARYGPPGGPGPEADAAAWTKWLAEHRAYLFFSEFAGYRWYVDPLAKARGVPTTGLRGPARADPPKPQ